MKTAYRVAWIALQAALAATAQAAGAGAALLDGGDGIVLSNAMVRLVIDPQHGGRVSSYLAAATGREIVPPGRKGVGLFTDHLWGQTWPGELFDAPYEAAIVRSGPDAAAVKVWRTVRGDWGGKQKMLEGLVIEKTYTLRANDPALLCRVAVRNPTAETRLPAYWSQHIFWTGGDYDARGDVLFRPSARGTIATSQTGQNTRDDFVRDPLAGWSAALDTAKAEGVVFLMDYNDLEMLYDCGGNSTLEWMYDKIPVPPGRAWETDIRLLPVSGARTVAHASTNLIAGVTLVREGAVAHLTHTLRAVSSEISGLTLATRIVGAGDRRETPLPPLAVGAVTGVPRPVTQDASGLSSDPLCVLVTASGRRGDQPFEESYFYFHAGGYGYGANVQQDLTTPLYTVPRPAKRQALMRPETIARERLARPQVFVMRGLHSETFGIEPALAAWGADVRHGEYSINTEGPRITDFPFDYSALMQQDAIVVANASIESLGNLGLQIFRDYLTHGGNLLLLGGKASYGGGGIAGSGLEDLLPVRVSEAKFDIGRIEPAAIRAAKQPHPAIAGLDWAALPAAYYLHVVEPKPGASVLLTAGGRPFLVVGDLPGGGRVACLLAAPYGGTAEQPPGALAAPGWPEFMRNLLAWLGGRDAQKVGGP
jgi:uncharacterized membrane protein